MENIAANGLKVMLYSDGGCFNKIGEVSRDGTCYSAPSDVRKSRSSARPSVQEID
jgi:hypothetical protein